MIALLAVQQAFRYSARSCSRPRDFHNRSNRRRSRFAEMASGDSQRLSRCDDEDDNFVRVCKGTMSVQYTRYNRVDLNGKFDCRFRRIVEQTRVSDVVLELCLVDGFDVSKTVGNDVTWRQRLLGNRPRDKVMIRNIMRRPNLDGRAMRSKTEDPTRRSSTLLVVEV